MRVAALVFFALLRIYTQAQAPFRLIRDLSIPVLDEESYQNPWTGGFNAPQFGELQLDADEETDLVVFDRSGNRWLTFLRNNGRFIYAPEYEAVFPACQGWMAVRDYDNDGRLDLFCSALSGISVFRNIGTPGQPAFELKKDLLYADYGNGLLNLFVSEPDYPAIDDLDGDGDLDIVTFYILGTCVEYHRNLSIELYGHADSLIYRLESDNWGLFTEDPQSNQVIYNDSCDRTSGGMRHSGSTLLLYDLDKDADPDLLLGDISYPQLLVLVNNPQSTQDLMGPLPPDYPEAYQQFGIPIFPAGFVLHANADTLPDLVVAPNTEQESLNRSACIVYPGTPGTFAFTGEAGKFLCHESPDLGLGSYPVIVDMDADGDFDLLAGTRGVYDPDPGQYQASLTLFLNTGSNEIPVFEMADSDFAGLKARGFQHLAPAAADLDQDGIPELIVGTQSGQLIYLNHTGNPDSFIFTEVPGMLPSFTDLYPVPFLFDVNQDGAADLLVGGRSGRIALCLNSGSSAIPEFTTIVTSQYGQVETVDEARSNYGYSAPAMFRFNGQAWLVSGSESGHLYLWKTGPDPNGIFELIDPVFAGIDEGSFSAVGLADFDGDQVPEMIFGNRRGGFSFFRGEPTVSVPSGKGNIEYSLYPNPARDAIRISAATSAQIERFSVIDISGRLIYQSNQVNVGEFIRLPGIAAGTYIAELISAGSVYSLRFIVQP